ncbi:MAG TPA: hypothetical protein VIC28_03035, partial [Thermoanaerobaculia bacterium]
QDERELQARLIFAGRGPRFASPAQQEQIQSFAAALFAEFAARRRGVVAPAGLLVPPGAGARAAEIVLELPEKAPLPPRPAPRTGPENQSDEVPQTSSSLRSRPQPVR